MFMEDNRFNEDEPQIFKDEYDGRIVISTGKIATGTNPTDKNWIIEYDKAGITIEDAFPRLNYQEKRKIKGSFVFLEIK
jgi:hypothetical protein